MFDRRRWVLVFLPGVVLTAVVVTITAAQTARRTLTREQLDRLHALQPSPVPLQVVGTNQPQYMAPDAGAVTLRQGQFVKSVAPPQASDVDGRRRYVLPVRFTGFDGATQRVVKFAPVLEVEQKAMRLDADGRLYRASVLVGLDDEESPGAARQLSQASVIQVSADGADVDRQDIPIQHTGSPYERIQLTSLAPGDTMDVTLRFVGERIHASIEVDRPRIVLSGVPGQLAGLGVGEATVAVQLSENAGAREHTVSVSFDPGAVQPNQVAVSAERPAYVRIRTAGLRDAASLTATCTALVPSTTLIAVMFPLGFLLAALVGGGLGSLCARLTRTNKSTRALMRHFVAGVIVGLIGAGLYVLGVNVSGVSLPIMNNELAVAVIAALVSIGGVKLLTKVSSRAGAALEAVKG